MCVCVGVRYVDGYMHIRKCAKIGRLLVCVRV